MKKLLSIFLVVTLMLYIMVTGIFSLTANALSSGATGDCLWSLNGTVLTIYGTGYMEDYEADYISNEDYHLTIAPWGDKISEVIILDGVKNVGDYAFSGCKSLTKVTLPESIEHIGQWSFAYCEKLESVTIPKNVSKIDWAPFLKCVNLKTVYYNALKASNGYQSQPFFNGCQNLKEIFIGNGVEIIPKGAFWGCSSVSAITIPETVETIDEYAFAYCSGLSAITIPKSVKKIHYQAFEGCDGVTQLNYNTNSVSDLGKPGWHCLSDFSNLKIVNIGENVTEIPTYAFYACRKLESLLIPKSVKTVYASAFEECDSLKNICYEGTQDEAENITISSSNIRFKSAKWFYNFCALNEQEHHTYSADCDNECDSCGWSRVSNVLHMYINNCDSDCNNCGTLREPPHKYDYKCDSYCDDCGFTRIVNHTYLDEYDENCDVCNIRRYYISYDTNGVTETYGTQHKFFNEHINLISSSPTRLGYHFAGWSTTKSGDVEYQSGDTYAPNKSVTLYAQWDLLCEECDGNGNAYQNCKTCGGDGEVAVGSKIICSTCNNKKFYCQRCGSWGDGNILSTEPCWCGSTKWYWCDECEGSGGWYHYDDCSACDGNGKVSNTCTKCDGTGEYIRTNVSAPSRPVLISKTSTTIILQSIENGEYSIDGVNWQDTHIFENLKSDETYTIYQRYAKTDTTLRSSTSEALTIMLVSYISGDIDGVEGVTDRDAVYLLYHTFLSDIYPVNQDCDFNGDGEVNDKDAVYLLYYTFLPDLYPIN